MLVVDLFAGPGGWDQGLRDLGYPGPVVGIEWDAAACQTRAAAGHATIRADVATYPTEPFVGKVTGLIASPPCQDFSLAGKRAGIDGERGQLVAEVLRWARALEPEWIACEQVPPVLPIWELYAHELGKAGYRTWAGILNAADYGVPQTRQRAILLATRGELNLPEPTHGKTTEGASLFGVPRQPWVSWGEALGLQRVVIHQRRGAGMAERHGERPDTPADAPAPTVTGSVPRRWLVLDRRTNSKDGKGGMVPTVTVPMDRPAPTLTGKAGTQWLLRNNSQTNAALRSPDQPAPTMFFGHHLNAVGFTPDADTPVNRGGRQITIGEASVLQSFQPDYPWQGTKTKQFEQVGNAIPPGLAAAILAPMVNAQEVAA